MINFRTIKYESKEKPSQVFSRLTWTTERVNILFNLIFSHTISTNKIWIGALNERELKFSLLEPRESFISSAKFIRVILRGRIIPSTNGSIIHISMRLGWFTLFLMFGISIATIAILINAVYITNLIEIMGIILWLIVFPGLLTYLIIRKLNNLELEIERTLGVDE